MRRASATNFLFHAEDHVEKAGVAFLEAPKVRARTLAMDSPTLAEHPAPEHSLRLEESSMDLMTSMKYAGGAALTGGAASAANMVFGVSVIGLLVFQFARSTVGKYIPQKQPELVPSPLLCTAEAEEDEEGEETACGT